MKTTVRIFVALSLAVAFTVTVLAADAPKAADGTPAAVQPTNAPAATPATNAPAETPADVAKNLEKAAKKAERQAARKAARKEAKAALTNETPTAPSPEAVGPAPTPAPSKEQAELRLNFRGVSLDQVLNYLSEAAGYTIVLETPVKGTVDVWSNQPLTKSEAIDLLNTVLNKNGYAAIQNGRTLTIVSREDAKRRDIPVVTGAAPAGIPKNDAMVTQIIPVKTMNAANLARDLAPLIPNPGSLTANEGGNSLLMTDTQNNIHRVAQIVAALDSQVSSAATLKIFPLRFADAKALATTIRDLFQDTTSNNGRGNRGGNGGGGFGGAGGFGGFGGGPGGFGGGDNTGGGGGGGGRGGSGGNSANSVSTAARVTAVADEHSNSLIVSASETQMATIERLIAEVDTDVQDLTELRVFHLKNADPTETAELLTSLFPDSTKQDDNRGGGFRFGAGPFQGGPFGGGQGNRGQNTTTTSERSKKQGKVIAVADARTSSMVVSAAKELMPQISEMVLQLDSSPAKKQKVFVYSLENADVQEVESVLRNLFESQNSRNTGNSSQNNALQNRANQASQNQSMNSSSFGNSGTGSGNNGNFR
jgi:general secretion pathway protein D